MRLDKLRIGTEKASPTHQFKNLKDINIDFNENEWVSVILGANGTGKSNVLEAIAVIFRDLISKKRSPAFAFSLSYRISNSTSTRWVRIEADPDRDREPYVIHLIERPLNHSRGGDNADFPADPNVEFENIVRFSDFVSDQRNLPKYIFSYYSGESPRMYDIFRPYLEAYDRKLRNGDDPGPKRLFYAMPVHSQFVLLSFLLNSSKDMLTFLNEHLGLDGEEGIESVLFVLKQPGWSKRRGLSKQIQDGDPRFWGARGIVQEFLSRLYDVSLAPVRLKRKVQVSLWNEERTEFLYLFLKDVDSLRRLVQGHTPSSFFRDLESTYVSELIDEVRIRVRIKASDGSLTFRELSEGEQQLLTVLGLLRFTAEENTLFLLDEPDTHLNPRWSVEYLSYLRSFLAGSATLEQQSQIIMTTHNPLAIAELVRDQVQILRVEAGTSRIQAAKPDLDPRGMGYAGIVTSDMFGLEAALDSHTLALLEEQRQLSMMPSPLSEEERHRLGEINRELEGYGFRYSMRDPDYEEYLRSRFPQEDVSAQRHPGELSPRRRVITKALISEVAEKVRMEKSEGTDATD